MQRFETPLYCISVVQNKKTMNKLKTTGKALRAIGYPEGPVTSAAMNVMQKNWRALHLPDQTSARIGTPA